MLRCLAGLESPARGRIEADGEVWFDDGAGVDVAAHHRAVGLVFQDSALFPHLSVARNLAYGWERAGRPGGQQVFAATVGAMGLEGLENRAPRTLSGGERQRVALGRALLRGPRVLLMDEPLGALDQEARSRMLDFLDRRLRELAIPVVYVTHALGEVLRLADRVVVIDGGRIRDRGEVVAMAPRLGTGDRAGVVLEVTTRRLDREEGLARLDTAVGELRLPLDGPAGALPRRLRILARDVSLALSRSRDTSILNVLPGRVTAVEDGPQPLATVAVGEGTILARITEHSRRALGIEPGREVFVQVKGVAVVR
jgi:molybdate transport system ATP-binding protein